MALEKSRAFLFVQPILASLLKDENLKKDFKEKTIVFSLSAHENIYAEGKGILRKNHQGFSLRSEGEQDLLTSQTGGRSEPEQPERGSNNRTSGRRSSRILAVIRFPTS